MYNFKRDLKIFWYSHSTLRKTIKRGVKLIACPFCWPCMFCFALFDRHCISKEERERKRIGEKLSGLLHSRREERVQNRKRELSVDRTGSKCVNIQKQSPLFSQLPAELRCKIYEMVLCETGGLHIHFSRDPYDAMALASTTCLELGNGSRNHPRCTELRMQKQRNDGNLGLLLACKNMYV